MDQFYICSCFFYKHIYLQRYKLHVDYHNDDQFLQDYSEILMQRGCHDDKLGYIIKEIKDEIERRKQRGKEHTQRCQMVQQQYHRLHPFLYTLNESFLHPDFLKIVTYCRTSSATQEGLLHYITKECASRVYSFPVFTDSFCQLFIEELDNFEQTDITKGRPNTMNKTGACYNY